MSEDAPEVAIVRLDEDAVQLLRAIHRGSAVRLAEEGRLYWRIDPRPTTRQLAAAPHRVTLESLSVSRLLSSAGRTEGSQDLTDPNDPESLRLGAGVLLIRLGLAARRGIYLQLTERGESLIASLIGDGQPNDLQFSVQISDGPIELPPFQTIAAADQRLVIYPSAAMGRTQDVALRFTAGDRGIDVVLTSEAVTAGLKTLDDAMAKSQRCFVQLGHATTLLKGGKEPKIEIEAIEGFDRAIVALRPPFIDAFSTAVTRALDEGLTTVLQQVAVAYGSFDAIYEESVSASEPPT